MKRLIFWDFARATWQYDVVVALILAFIFLTPREIFKDQPRASSVVRLPAEHGNDVFFIQRDLLTTGSAEGMRAQAAELIQKQTGKRPKVLRVDVIQPPDQEIEGYMAYLQP